jgi:hypothetical protein
MIMEAMFLVFGEFLEDLIVWKINELNGQSSILSLR